MQTIEFCGFSISYSRNQADYMEIKRKIESCVKTVERYMKKQGFPRENIVCHFVKAGMCYLTMCVDNYAALHIGIYDSKTNTIITRCSDRQMQNINLGAIDILSERMINALSGMSLCVSPRLIQAWQEQLREQQTELDNEYDDYER